MEQLKKDMPVGKGGIQAFNRWSRALILNAMKAIYCGWKVWIQMQMWRKLLSLYSINKKAILVQLIMKHKTDKKFPSLQLRHPNDINLTFQINQDCQDKR